jgi:alpha-1,3-rhamnosyl/mannosyltransferase
MSAFAAMVFGIDARSAADEGAGRGRVARELLRALAARDDDVRYELYARRRWDDAALDGRFVWRELGSRDPLWHWRVARTASRSCDAFLSLDSYLTPWFASTPTVTFVYDMLTFDPLIVTNRRSTVVERLTLGRAVRHSAALVCHSRATADALVDRFPAAQGKLEVIPLAPSPAMPDPNAFPALKDGFVLAVGTLEPRKNLPRLAAAYGRLPEQLQRRHPLVVIGRLGWETGETIGALDALGDRCQRLGYVPDAAVAALYARCAVFCYPSLGEGFGLPVLEALHAGAPTITSDRSSLPEVAGDAAELVDPTSVDAIAETLRALLEDPARRARLAEAGPRRAAGFSWERTAAGIVGVLERAARAGVSPGSAPRA